MSEDDWLTVQGAITTRSARSREDVALLAGLVRCASCGHVMSRRTGTTYTCHQHHSAGECPRPAAITKATLDAHVEQIALKELKKLEPRATNGERVEGLRSELRVAQRELEAYLEGVAAAGLTIEQYAKGARLRRDELDRRRERLAEALAREAAPVDGDPLRVWGELDSRRRNQLLRGLFECVLVAPGGARKTSPGRRPGSSYRPRCRARASLPRRRDSAADRAHPPP